MDPTLYAFLLEVMRQSPVLFWFSLWLAWPILLLVAVPFQLTFGLAKDILVTLQIIVRGHPPVSPLKAKECSTKDEET